MNKDNIRMVQTIGIIFMVSLSFVTVVYDYGNYQNEYLKEFQEYTATMVAFENELNKDFNKCVEDAKAKCQDELCVYWGLPTGYWVYDMNGIKVVAYSESAYGCELIHLIYYKDIEQWKQVNNKSYWAHMAERLSMGSVSADESQWISTMAFNTTYNDGYATTSDIPGTVYVMQTNNKQSLLNKILKTSILVASWACLIMGYVIYKQLKGEVK